MGAARSGAAAEAEGHHRVQETSERPAWGLLRMEARLWLTAPAPAEEKEGESRSFDDLPVAELERPKEDGSRRRAGGAASISAACAGD